MSPGPVPGVDLRDGEVLLWTGRPDPSVLFTRADAFLVPFSVYAFVTSALFTTWATTGALQTPQAPPGLVGLYALFTLGSAYLLVGRFVVKRRTKRRTHYAVTDQRAIIVTGTSGVSFADLTRPSIALRFARDRQHVTIVVGTVRSPVVASAYGNTGLELLGWRTSPPFAFYDVADVAGLTSALRTAAQR
ncbi:hypothetical protein ACUN7V_11880 [Quadrisphaera oryzae]|uniref:hypothetical protein n=1 Tax=Quadrisphaera TaxID=317661 RepID=UPI001646BE06|nr:hypothetical protein [Quadrisphaera sp. RL12-1S]MBC3763278.1 hypothetical protein [Quadrisphaera sp. RL12-1S]